MQPCLLYRENFLPPTFAGRNFSSDSQTLYYPFSLLEGDHLKTCGVECLYNRVSGHRIHSLLLVAQSGFSWLSVEVKGT
jgi:hypothetical protein